MCNVVVRGSSGFSNVAAGLGAGVEESSLVEVQPRRPVHLHALALTELRGNHAVDGGGGWRGADLALALVARLIVGLLSLLARCVVS